MIEYRNECCDCRCAGYPCLGSSCARIRVPHKICDWCGEETDRLYSVDGKEICGDCAVSAFPYDPETDTYNVYGEQVADVFEVLEVCDED